MRISRNPGFSQPLSDFTAKRNPDRTPRSLSAGGQFRPARACAGHARAIFTARTPPPRVPERCSWQDYLQSKPAEEAKHKESRGAPGNQFPLLRDARKHTLSQQWLAAIVPGALRKLLVSSSRGSCASSSQVSEAISGIVVGRFWA